MIYSIVLGESVMLQYESLLMIIRHQQPLMTDSSRGVKERRRMSRKCAVPQLRVKQKSRGVTVPVQSPVSVTARRQGYRQRERERWLYERWLKTQCYSTSEQLGDTIRKASIHTQHKHRNRSRCQCSAVFLKKINSSDKTNHTPPCRLLHNHLITII